MEPDGVSCRQKPRTGRPSHAPGAGPAVAFLLSSSQPCAQSRGGAVPRGRAPAPAAAAHGVAAMACVQVHSAGMWHCSGSRQAGMNPCALSSATSLRVCMLCVHDSRASAATALPPQPLVHRGLPGSHARRGGTRESGEGMWSLSSDVAPRLVRIRAGS
jgi:hypothetical protein